MLTVPYGPLFAVKALVRRPLHMVSTMHSPTLEVVITPLVPPLTEFTTVPVRVPARLMLGCLVGGLGEVGVVGPVLGRLNGSLYRE